MNTPAGRQALGRGLESLLKPKPDVNKAAATRPTDAQLAGLPNLASTAAAAAPAPAPIPPGEQILKVPMAQIAANPHQPRRHFAEDGLRELADSIRAQGILQPLLVRKVDSGYQIIAGERRFRAAQLAGLNELPAILRNANEEKTLELAIIENLQREDLNPMEQARAFRQLAAQFSLTQEQIAERTGKDRATVANFVRLLRLHPDVQTMVEEGKLTMGHARALLALEGDQQKELAEKVVTKGLNVRQIEDIVAAAQCPPEPKPAKPQDPNVKAAEQRFAEALGTKVRIRDRKGSGTIEIDYYGVAEFQRIYERFVD